MIARAAKHGQIASIWHPDCNSDVYLLPNGSHARFLTGKAAYQYTDGLIINLENT